jgi:hypothetical protein
VAQCFGRQARCLDRLRQRRTRFRYQGFSLYQRLPAIFTIDFLVVVTWTFADITTCAPLERGAGFRGRDATLLVLLALRAMCASFITSVLPVRKGSKIAKQTRQDLSRSLREGSTRAGF